MDGWVKIGIGADTKQLEKDLQNAKKRLQQYEREAERLSKQKLKLELDSTKTMNELSKIDNKLEMIEQEIKEMERVDLAPNLTKNLDYQKLISQREQLNNKAQEYLQKLEMIRAEQTNINNKTKQNVLNQEQINEEINELNGRFNGMNLNFDKIGNGLSGIIKKVGKWALAVFSIRTAYNFVRNAVSTLSQYNQQLAADLEYINFSLAMAMEPVVRIIVNLVYQLLGLINYITMALFDYNLFAEASADNFRSMSGSAKEIRKTLAGFDEMNILGDNVSSSGGVGGNKPSYDLSDYEFNIDKLFGFEDKIYGMFDRIRENVTQVIDEFAQKLGMEEGWNLFIASWKLNMNGAIDIVEGTFTSITGILKILMGIITGDSELVKEGFVDLFDGFIQIVAGMINNLVGAIGTIVGFIVGIISDLFRGIWKDITDFFNKKVEPFFSGKATTLGKIFGRMGTLIGESFKNAFKTVINGVIQMIETRINSVISGINGFLNIINKVPGVNISKINGVNLPRLAVGGVVNMPGRGVMVGGAITGERGPEGVIPLTNSQMMAELGEAIGRYITINANITNTMNGRVISRELQKVNNNNDFALNR